MVAVVVAVFVEDAAGEAVEAGIEVVEIIVEAAQYEAGAVAKAVNLRASASAPLMRKNSCTA